MLWSLKQHLHANDGSFKPIKIDILIRHKSYYLLVYNMFYSQADTNLTPILWALYLQLQHKLQYKMHYTSLDVS